MADFQANNMFCSNINSTRYPIPDVPVLYLVEPTAKNIDLITSDLVNDLYSPAYVNFLYSIPRPLLEEFASKIAESGTSSKIAQVYDQYLNYVVAEPDLFSLGLGKDMYFKINSAQSSDEQIDALMDQIVNGLLSVSVTMGNFSTLFRFQAPKHSQQWLTPYSQDPYQLSGAQRAMPQNSSRRDLIENYETTSSILKTIYSLIKATRSVHLRQDQFS